MKKPPLLICLSALICVLGVACGDGGEPNTYVTECYLINNQTESDIVIERHTGEVTTIIPGEIREVQKFDMVYEPGIAYSRSMYTVDRAVMKIGEEVVPDSVWLFEYWDCVREDGEDDYHYSLTYTLTVTDELLETIQKEEDHNTYKPE
jgi:hypothetical protein